MRIVVNDIAATSGGALTVLESFHHYVRRLDTDHEWIFLLGDDLLEESSRVRIITLPRIKNSWPRRLFFEAVSGRRLIESLQPDAVFSLQNICTSGVSCPQVVYLHQSLPFQRSIKFSWLRREERLLSIYQFGIGALIKWSIRGAAHVIVQTKWMRDAILDQVRISGDRVTSVLPGLEDLGDKILDRPFDSRAFFYPTAAHSYKNNDCVVAACDLLRSRGLDNFSVTMTLDPIEHAHNIHFVGRLTRQEVLQRLSCTTLIFPSLTESYGLPLAEARALGVLVLAADLPYAREVLEGYSNAQYFDPASPTELADLMFQVSTGKIARLESSEARPRKSAPTAWAEVVEIIETCAREERLGRWSDWTEKASGNFLRRLRRQ